MKRRILALVLALAMLLPCLMGEARAATSGKCGDNATWEFDAGTLTISGSGDMWDCTARPEERPWYENFSEIQKVVIGDKITAIGDFAFDACGSLREVAISDSVTRIGVCAFRNTKVGSITIPESVTSIGDEAFSYCEKLKNVTFPSSLTYIDGQSLFWWCTSLENVTLGDSLTNIPDHMFYRCVNLAEIELPDTVTSIGRSAFCDCMHMTGFTIPESVTYIGSGAWCGCNLKSIYIPKSVTYIGVRPFLDCSDLEEIVVDEANTAYKAIDGILYTKDQTEILSCPENYDFNDGHYEVSEGVETICDSAFRLNNNLKSIALPETISNIGWLAFYGCESLADVYYVGTETDREEIFINSDNYYLENATWHYNYIASPAIKCSADTTSGKPKLTWSAVSGAEKYRIYRATSKTGTYSYLATSTGTSYIDKSAVAGTNYYYKTKALDTDTNTYSAYSNIVNRMCDLAKPVVSQTVNTTTGKPVVKWETVEGAAKYYVYRSTSKSGSYEKVYTGVKARSYEDANAVAGTNYYYKVMAIHEKSSANSAYSAVVNRVCDLAKPTVTLTRTDAGNPWVKWTAVKDADGYEVWRATSKSGTYKKVKTTVSGTSFADRNVTEGKTYYYKVRAIHAKEAANSAYSSIKSITAK